MKYDQATETVNLDDLPTSLRMQTVADVACDARNLETLVDNALDKLISITLPEGEEGSALQSAIALLWVARDLAQTAEWKLDRMTAQGKPCIDPREQELRNEEQEASGQW